MRKIIAVAFIAAGIIASTVTISFASDWDKAGKVLTIIEGLRVFTGGKVDLIGAITGINSPRQESRSYRYSRGFDYPRYVINPGGHYEYYKDECCTRVWVPHYVWKEKYVPQHTEYKPGYGEVMVEGHYERYLVQEGGHWEIMEVRCPRGH